MSYHDAQDLDRHPKNEAQRNKLRDDRYEELLIDIPKQIRSGGSYTTGSGHTKRITTALELVALNFTPEMIEPFIKLKLADGDDGVIELIMESTNQIREAIRLTADQLAQDYMENM